MEEEIDLVGGDVDTFQEGTWNSSGVRSFCARAIIRANQNVAKSLAIHANQVRAVSTCFVRSGFRFRHL